MTTACFLLGGLALALSVAGGCLLLYAHFLDIGLGE